MRKFLGSLVLLGLLVFAFGLILDWWDVTTTSQAGSDEVGVTIHKDKLKDDLGKAKNAVEDIGKELSGSDEVVEGVITSLDRRSRVVGISVDDGKKISLLLKNDLVIHLEDGTPSDLTSLGVGDQVEVWYDEKEDELQAVRIDIKKKG